MVSGALKSCFAVSSWQSREVCPFKIRTHSPLPVSNTCRFQKSSYQEHLQITLKFRLNYAVLHISSEHWTAQLNLLNSSEPSEENVVYSIVSLT